MTTERIKQIQEQTAYPNSVSVQQALLQVWNECGQEYNNVKEDVLDIINSENSGMSHQQRLNEIEKLLK